MATLEKEGAYLRERRGDDAKRIDALENRSRDVSSTAKAAQLALGERTAALERLAPRAEHDAELLSRYQADNARLVRLLERAPEYQQLANDAAAAKGLHYVPLRDVFLEAGEVSERYEPLDDRPVVLDSELFYWVPTQVGGRAGGALFEGRGALCFVPWTTSEGCTCGHMGAITRGAYTPYTSPSLVLAASRLPTRFHAMTEGRPRAVRLAFGAPRLGLNRSRPAGLTCPPARTPLPLPPPPLTLPLGAGALVRLHAPTRRATGAGSGAHGYGS